MSGSINLGIPDIAVVLRENTDTNNVVLDVPNISVTVEHAPDYKVSVQPSSLIVHRTGSLPSLAVSALTASYALSASYIAGGTVTSASYAAYADSASLATTASYALNAQGTGFPFSGSAVITGSLVVTGAVSASSITGSFKGDGSQLTGIVSTLQITGSTGQDSVDLKTQGLLITGSNGISTTVTDNTVTIAAPAGTVTSSQQINVFQTTGGDNVATLGANTFNGKQTIFGDLEIDTGNIVVTSGNSVIVSGAIFVQNEFTAGFVSASSVDAQSITGSLLGTASVAEAIDVIFAGNFEVGNEPPIALQVGGTGNVISASYALTASYAANGGGSIPAGTISSSTQISALGFSSQSINTSSFATTGSNTFTDNQIVNAKVGVNTSNFTDAISGTDWLKIEANGTTFGFADNAPSGQGYMSVTNGTVTGFGAHVNNTDGMVFGSFNSYPLTLRTGNVNRVVIGTDGATTFNYGITGSLFGTASFAITASHALNAGQNIPAGTISSSTQVIASLPAGTVSSSAQINTSSFATTGSNAFKDDQIITGSLYVTNNLIVQGSSSISYVSQSTLNIGTNLVTVNAQNPEVRFGGLAVIDSGSSPRVSGSLLFDSVENQWIFVHQGTTPTSSLLLMGPETYNNIGNELHPTTNKVLKSINDEHIGDSQITDDGITVSITNGLSVGTSITASQANITTIRATSVTASVSGALTGTFPYNNLTGIPSGIVSSSAQYPGWVTSSAQINTGSFSGSITTASFATTASYALNSTALPAGTVSSSTQVVWSQVNYNTGIISSSTQLPAGTVSSSAQYPGWVTSSAQINTGSFSGSFTGSLTGTITSASYAITASFAASATAITPAGTVSSSAQYPGWVTSSTQIVNALPAGVVSSSTQVSNYNIFATTGSNTFIGNQTITGSLSVSSTASFNGNATANDVSLLLTNSSSLLLTSGSSIYVAAPGYITSSVTGSLTGSLLGTSSWAVSSSNVLPSGLPAGLVSSSLQFNLLSSPFTGSFTGSFVGTNTGSLFGTSSWAVSASNAATASFAVTSSYTLPTGLPVGLVSSSTQVVQFGTIRLQMGTNRSNASAFYFNSNTRTSSDSAAPVADTAFLVQSSGLSTVTVYLRQDNAGPNATIVGVAKNANGTAFSTATLLTSSSLSLTVDTIQTYTFSGLTLNQFDAIHIYCDPTSTPGTLFAVVLVS